MAKQKGKKKKQTGGMSANNAALVNQLSSGGNINQIKKLAAKGVQEAVDFIQRRETARTKNAAPPKTK